MLLRFWQLFAAAFFIVVVLNAGWLANPHDRLGGILVLAICAAGIVWALRPRRD